MSQKVIVCMFFVHSHGRMGNQLFQYAFTTSLEKNLGAKGFFVTNEQYVFTNILMEYHARYRVT